MTQAFKHAQDAVLPHLQSAQVAEPGKGALDFPAPTVAAQLAPVRVRLAPLVAAVGNNQLDPAPPQPSPPRIAVVTTVSDDPLRSHSRSSSTAAWNPYPRQRRLGQSHLVGRGRRDANSQRYTLAIGQYHGFRALAALRFANREAPFLAGKKVASRNVSSHCNSPFWSSVPNSARQACSQMPRSSHCRSRRQHVVGLGYCGGRSRHRAPDRKTQRIPSTQARLSAAGRPRRRLPRAFGNKFSITAHCRSVSLIPKLKPGVAISRKCLT